MLPQEPQHFDTMETVNTHDFRWTLQKDNMSWADNDFLLKAGASSYCETVFLYLLSFESMTYRNRLASKIAVAKYWTHWSAFFDAFPFEFRLSQVAPRIHIRVSTLPTVSLNAKRWPIKERKTDKHIIFPILGKQTHFEQAFSWHGCMTTRKTDVQFLLNSCLSTFIYFHCLCIFCAVTFRLSYTFILWSVCWSLFF